MKNPAKTDLVVTFFCALGIFSSVELLRLHYIVHMDPLYKSWCIWGPSVNCAVIESSEIAALGYLPQSLIGLLSYVVLILFLLGRGENGETRFGLGLSLILSLFLTSGSILNFYESIAQFGTLNPVRVLLLIVNLGLFLRFFTLAKSNNLGVRKVLPGDLRWLRRRPVRTLSTLLVIATILAGVALFLPKYWMFSFPAPHGSQDVPVGITSEGHHWFGSENPKIIIEEFSDYQCPHCVLSHREIRDFIVSRSADIRLIHRQFPLDNSCNRLIDGPFHTHACLAAKAVLCTETKQQFWLLSDLLYAYWNSLNDKTVFRLAEKIGLDNRRFRSCIDSIATTEQVKADVDAGIASGGRGTPFYVIDGKYYRGKMNRSRLQNIIDSVRPE